MPKRILPGRCRSCRHAMHQYVGSEQLGRGRTRLGKDILISQSTKGCLTKASLGFWSLSGILEEARGVRAPCPEEPCRRGSFLPWASLRLQTLHVQRGQKFGLFCAVLGSGMTSLWGSTRMRRPAYQHRHQHKGQESEMLQKITGLRGQVLFPLLSLAVHLAPHIPDTKRNSQFNACLLQNPVQG